MELLTTTPVLNIFDVGAFDGATARRYRETFPSARVYAFEPSPEAWAILSAVADQDPMIYPLRLAVSDVQGRATLNLNKFPATNSLLSAETTGSAVDCLTMAIGSVGVDTVTLDSIALREGIQTIDILKLDLQGGELAALKGAEQLVAEGRVRLIYSEVEFLPIYHGQPLAHQVISHLAARHYPLIGLYDLHWLPNGRLAWADALFAHEGVIRA